MRKMPKEQHAKVKGISMPPEIWKEVEDVAGALGLSNSALIRMAVIDYLKDGGRPTNGVKPVAA